jgi:hypothetical protein
MGNFPVLGVSWGLGDASWIGANIDYWLIKNPLGGGDKLSYYIGLGASMNFYTGDNAADDFAIAGRIPLGLQFMLTEKIELFGEWAATFYFVPEFEASWEHFAFGGRFIL